MLIDKIKQSQLTQLNFSPKNLTWSSWLCLTRDRARCPLAISNISLCQDPQILPPSPPGDKPTSEIFSPRNLCTLLSRSPMGSCTSTTAAGRQQLIFEPRANNRRQSPRPEWVSRRSRIVRRTDAFSFSTTEYVFVLYLAQLNTYLCCIWHNGISWIPVVFITQRTTELAVFVLLDRVNITLSQDLGI